MSDLRAIELAIRALADATSSGGVGGGTGTVTSVDLSAPSDIFSVTGNPVTTAGTISLSKVSQAQRLFYASPSGASGVPSFRGIADVDLPATISRITSVDLSAPSDLLTVGSSPLTANGTISLTKTSQAQGLVYASPAAASGAPTFRALAASDIPNLDASKLTSGTLAYDRMPSGSVIRKAFSELTITNSHSNTTYTATGFSISYTPIYSTSTLLISFNVAVSIANAAAFADIAIYRDGANITNYGTGPALLRQTDSRASAAAPRITFAISAPATATTSTTFELYTKRAGGAAGDLVKLGGRTSDTNLDTSTLITVEEIKA